MSIAIASAGSTERLAAVGLRASALVGTLGLVLLAGMFAAFGLRAQSTGMTLGWLNDLTGVVTLPLAVPGVLVLHRRLRPRAGVAADGLLLVGLGAGGSIVVLQALLVNGTLTFERQIGMVSVAMLVLMAWFVLYGVLASRHGILPGGGRLGAIAATYVGYPVWAWRIAPVVERGAVATSAAEG